MKKLLLLITILFYSTIVVSQNDPIKQEFIKNINSDKIKEGCKITVYIINAGANAACFVPEPTVSKVACAAAQIMNLGTTYGMDPNIPHPITDFGVEICTLSYSYTDAGIKYTFEFAKNQVEEINETWSWLNSLEGALQFMEYISH
jgi:hypothetical protein